MTPPPRLYISHDEDLDWLIACEFGRVDDGQPQEHWRGVSDAFGFLDESPGGRTIGFKVLAFSEFDVEDPEVEEIWSEPRFDAPLLGLLNASAGEVVLAASTHFAGRSSLNRQLFTRAIGLKGEEAIAAWQLCLQAGDSMAHFALGYTLLDLGRGPEAYRHLRHYAEIAPAGAWNWCYYGRAAAEVGEPTEARRAFRRAIELTASGGEDTDADERLAALGEAEMPRARTATDNRVVLMGDELPQLGRRRIEALTRRTAVGLTAGAKAKAYDHTDPNEDAIAVVERDGATVLVCADGHNGMVSSRAAIEVVLERLDATGADGLTDDELVDLWHAASERVIQAGARPASPRAGRRSSSR